ncbi:uncharacterized protein HaLaN_26825, partial [Haematococcus lacustris]
MSRWYSGVVTAFNQQDGSHTVTYSDGDVLDHLLRHEAVQWLDGGSRAGRRSKGPGRRSLA